jgi:alpha-L-fucosidase
MQKTKNYNEWFNQAKFGMFIHWGLYSLIGKGEWIMRHELISKDEYAKFAKKFNPSKNAPKEWAALAKKTGMKYMVFTSRHHDGFCLFDSKASDFTSSKTASGCDFVAEYVKACRNEGLKVGIYYSLGDWRFGFPKISGTPKEAKKMVQQAHEQVRELMTNYGKIDILWYDGGWVYPSMPEDGAKEVAKFWQARKLNKMVRELQPDILINNRSGLKCDFGTPEQHVLPEKGRLWECCMTIGSEHSWGYVKNDPAIKTAGQLIDTLVTSSSLGGNYLLNIGPKADGSVPKILKKSIAKIETWMKLNGESIYGSESSEISCMSAGIASVNNGHYYFHVLRWPGKEFTLTNVKGKIKSATILKTGQKIKIEDKGNNRFLLKKLSVAPPDPYDTVIKLELEK